MYYYYFNVSEFPERYIYAFVAKRRQMFLLVSSHRVGAHLDGHQYGVFIQISINLGKKISPYISLKKNCCGLNLGESLCIFRFFLLTDSGLYLLNGFDFYFDVA